MFTGIIEEVGRVLSMRTLGGGREIRILAKRVLDDLKVEDSIAVAGVCLTVTGLEPDGFRVQAVPETLEKTLTGELRGGDQVNLERALTLQTRLGGHLVQGHVDSTATLGSIRKTGLGAELEILLPAQLARLVSRTGSITIAGVSLTVAEVPEVKATDQGLHRVRVAVIPFTLEHTTLASLKVGERVNVECDCLAKMVERLLEIPAGTGSGQGHSSTGLTMDQLLKAGF